MNEIVKPVEACLMHGMAERLGTDVDVAARSGVITKEEAHDMVTRCASCTSHDACIIWLMEHQGRQAHPPAYCLNTQELQFVRSEFVVPDVVPVED